ncbi:NAD-dependent epimerase/dehydratase family protein [soil metagenome]
MKAFVTGGTGFIGTHLIQELDQAGWEIVALHRPNSDLRELKKCRKIELCVGDITDAESLHRAIPEKVDAVFHVAGSVGNIPHAQESSRYLVNQTGSRNMVEACWQKEVGRFIYTSTVLTYDFHAFRPLTENASPNLWCKDPYIHSKRLADEEIQRGQSLGLDVVYLHPSAVFGAYDKDTWSKMFLEIQRGLPLPFAPPGGGSVCHARPVAQAHVAAFSKGKSGQHYILGGPDVTWLQVAQQIAELLKKTSPRWALPDLLFKIYGWSEFSISNLLGREPMLTPHTIDILSETINSISARAINELSYTPSSLREMLVDCHQWMVREGML